MTDAPAHGFHRFLIKDAVPYGEALPRIMAGYRAAYLDVLKSSERDPQRVAVLSSEDMVRRINSHFYRYVASISNHVDPHLAQGPGNASLRVSDREGKAPKRPTRYSLLFSRMFSRASALTNRLREARERIPNKRDHVAAPDQPALIYSPLFFCRLLLTSPQFLAGQALSHAVIRAYIFEEALKFERVWEASATDERNTEAGSEPHRNGYVRIRELIRFDRVEASLRKLESYAQKRDNLPLKDGTDFIVSHLLASKGLLMMRFEGPDGFVVTRGDDRNPTITLKTFLSSEGLVPSAGVYQFDKPKEIRRFPTAAELINELDGLPLAVPGATEIFQGGIRFTTQSGVVARLSGPPGIGKTSFALSVAAALAPLGTQTIYLSCEERTDDLLHRIRTLVPPFLKRTQTYTDPDRWFSSHHVQGTHREKREQVFRFLREAVGQYGENLPSPENCPPGLMPLLIVLDGVHEMFPTEEISGGGGEELRALIETCQQTGAFVIAMSAENVRADLAEFDYLVDIVAALEYAGGSGEMNPPARVFNLRKTRRQLSRTGAHGFELTYQDVGLRLFPHIHSYLDENRGRFWIEPSRKNVVDFLLRREGFVPSAVRGEPLDEPLVQIQDHAQTLVMGRGSSGKSLFGLRLLGSAFLNDKRLAQLIDRRRERANERLSPNLFAEEDLGAQRAPSVESDEWFEDVDPSVRRILVISFLYQAAYYEELRRNSQRHWTKDSISSGVSLRLQIDVEHLSPGFIRPEEFISNISDLIEAAEFEGLPYHGVLVDGIHNVFLQFPKLETSELVWPTLYEMLRVRGVSVVTTHTYFDLSEFGGVMHDIGTSHRRVAPLLHALVQSSDYVIKIHPLASLAHDDGDFARAARDNVLAPGGRAPENPNHRPPQPARYLVEVPGALSPIHVEPPVDWGWDRERGTMFQVRRAISVEGATPSAGRVTSRRYPPR